MDEKDARGEDENVNKCHIHQTPPKKIIMKKTDSIIYLLGTESDPIHFVLYYII